jgi:hypothetical protein
MNKIMSFALLVTVSLLFTPQSFGQTTQKQKAKPSREQTQKNAESATIDKTQWPHCCWVDITSEIIAKPAQESIPADSATTSAPAAASGLSAGSGEAPPEEAVTEEATKGKGIGRKVVRRLGKVLLDKMTEKKEGDSSEASTTTTPTSSSSSGYIGETEKNPSTVNPASAVEEVAPPRANHRRQGASQNQVAASADGVVSEEPKTQGQARRKNKNQATVQNTAAPRDMGNRMIRGQTKAAQNAGTITGNPTPEGSKVQTLPPAQRAPVIRATKARNQIRAHRKADKNIP